MSDNGGSYDSYSESDYSSRSESDGYDSVSGSGSESESSRSDSDVSYSDSSSSEEKDDSNDQKKGRRKTRIPNKEELFQTADLKVTMEEKVKEAIKVLFEEDKLRKGLTKRPGFDVKTNYTQNLKEFFNTIRPQTSPDTPNNNYSFLEMHYFGKNNSINTTSRYIVDKEETNFGLGYDQSIKKKNRYSLIPSKDESVENFDLYITKKLEDEERREKSSKTDLFHY